MGLIEHVHFFCIFLLCGLFLIHLLLTNGKQSRNFSDGKVVKSGKVYHPPPEIFAVSSHIVMLKPIRDIAFFVVFSSSISSILFY